MCGGTLAQLCPAPHCHGAQSPPGRGTEQTSADQLQPSGRAADSWTLPVVTVVTLVTVITVVTTSWADLLFVPPLTQAGHTTEETMLHLQPLWS